MVNGVPSTGAVRGALVVMALVVAVGVAGGIVLGWRLLDGIRHPAATPMSGQADAVVVFAGEERRFALGRDLVEAGQAPVLVLSAARLPALVAGWCDEQPVDFEVVCVVPDPTSTSGEASAFAALASERGWGSLLGVTGDYHAQRAGLLLSRCFDGELSWALVDWPTPSWSLTWSEGTKTAGDWLLSRSC